MGSWSRSAQDILDLYRLNLKLDDLEREINALGRRAWFWQMGFWFALGFAVLGWLH